jgi:mRNA interferase MazF
MRRGEVWVAAGGPDYAGKPRPVIILQDDRFDGTDSVTVCGLTTTRIRARVERIPIDPTPENGLHVACDAMVDKVVTMPRRKLSQAVGRLAAADMARISASVIVFLGLAG